MADPAAAPADPAAAAAAEAAAADPAAAAAAAAAAAGAAPAAADPAAAAAAAAAAAPAGPAALVAEPGQATLPAAGGKSTHQLQNPGGVKMMFKVKSSNNNEYRVNPVFGFVEAGANTPLEVTRLAGAPKEDKLVVHFAPAPPDATDAQAAFPSATPTGNVTINLSAT